MHDVGCFIADFRKIKVRTRHMAYEFSRGHAVGPFSYDFVV